MSSRGHRAPTENRQPAPPPAPGAPHDGTGPQAERSRGWSTSSFGHAPDTSPLELMSLGDHLHRCSVRGGRWFALRCRVEAMQSFVASHIVTTLVVAALLIGAALLVV